MQQNSPENTTSDSMICLEKESKNADIIPSCGSNPNISFNISNRNLRDGFCYYLGILLLSPYLNRLKSYGLGMIQQWLVVILLGAKNIEQTKTLDKISLEVLLGSYKSNLHSQRKLLKELAVEDNINKLFRFNAELAKVNNCTDFYYDPHVKHYTGQLKILKGWCPKVGRPDKVLEMDFIHTSEGFPVYFASQDNYDDLRQRYPKHIEAFRTIANIPNERTLTFVVDRGIFALEVFKNIKVTKNQHIITWEKGYNKDGWNEADTVNYGSIVKKPLLPNTKFFRLK